MHWRSSSILDGDSTSHPTSTLLLRRYSLPECRYRPLRGRTSSESNHCPPFNPKPSILQGWLYLVTSVFPHLPNDRETDCIGNDAHETSDDTGSSEERTSCSSCRPIDEMRRIRLTESGFHANLMKMLDVTCNCIPPEHQRGDYCGAELSEAFSDMTWKLVVVVDNRKTLSRGIRNVILALWWGPWDKLTINNR